MAWRVVPSYYSPTGFQRLPVSGTVVSLTLPTEPPVTRAVLIQAETDMIRFRLDGGDPDGTNGQILMVADNLELTNRQMISNFRAIKVTNDAVLQIFYFGGNF